MQKILWGVSPVSQPKAKSVKNGLDYSYLIYHSIENSGNRYVISMLHALQDRSGEDKIPGAVG